MANERGPEHWTPLSDDERNNLDSIPVKDFGILNTIVPRLWRPAPLADTMLALEVLSGPFKGVIFTFKNFEILPVQLDGGWLPTKFSVKLWVTPAGFEPTEEWDKYTTELLIAWLSYMTTHDLKAVASAKPTTRIQ